MQNLKFILLLPFITLVYFVQGQNIIGQNLVQNPSFEDYITCPYSSGQLYKSTHWWGASTDYYNSCNTGGGQVSVPINFNGNQFAKSGVAYAGFIVYFHNAYNNGTYNETIKNALNDSLKKNSHYCIKYFISLAEFTYKYIQLHNGTIVYDSIGAMVTVNQVADDVNTIICDTCAKFAKSIVNIDTLNWFKISGSLIANGGEKYLTIGKFNIMNWIPSITCQFYIYVDDVSVCECNFDFDLGPDTKLCVQDKIILNPNLPNATYTWQDSSHSATYEVKRPGTYWVRAYIADYDITSTDTIVITAEDEAICNPPLIIPNIITPNGDGFNDYFKIGNAEKYELNLQIFNRWGNLIYRNASYQNDFSCKECANGVYYYLLNAKSLGNGKEKAYNGSVTVMN